MTIDLTTFKTIDRVSTYNWSEILLTATDSRNGKSVTVAIIDYATGALNDYPHASHDNQLAQIEKFKTYLINNDINDGIKWHDKATCKAKGTFRSCFKSDSPDFSRI